MRASSLPSGRRASHVFWPQGPREKRALWAAFSLRGAARATAISGARAHYNPKPCGSERRFACRPADPAGPRRRPVGPAGTRAARRRRSRRSSSGCRKMATVRHRQPDFERAAYLDVVPALKAAASQAAPTSASALIRTSPISRRFRPTIAFIIDIRRDNLLLHLLFKALFSAARNRVEYLGLLTGRALPERLDTLAATRASIASSRHRRAEGRTAGQPAPPRWPRETRSPDSECRCRPAISPPSSDSTVRSSPPGCP